MFNKLHIAIIGGGPAGLLAAVMLHQGGHQVQVYEAELHGSQRAQGGSLDLHPHSGQLALARAGLLDAFRQIARHEDQEQRSANPWTGEIELGVTRPGEDIDKPEIDRGELRKLLLDALPAESLHWGHRLSCMNFGAGQRYDLVFTNGALVEADIVIGADGARSRVRAFLGGKQPLYTGITFFEGWIEDPKPEITKLVGHGTLFCFGGEEAIFAQRNGKGRICVYAALKRSNAWLDEQLAAADLGTVMASAYAAWAPQLRQLLDACGDFARRPIDSLPADFSWAPRPGVTLIGDAAHLMPPMGTGVNLALLDASELAQNLCASPDWGHAIRQAEAGICDRVQNLLPQTIARFQDWFAPQT